MPPVAPRNHEKGARSGRTKEGQMGHRDLSGSMATACGAFPSLSRSTWARPTHRARRPVGGGAHAGASSTPAPAPAAEIIGVSLPCRPRQPETMKKESVPAMLTADVSGDEADSTVVPLSPRVSLVPDIAAYPKLLPPSVGSTQSRLLFGSMSSPA